jgi:hypothetical protein
MIDLLLGRLAAQNHHTRFGSLRNAQIDALKAGCAAHARNYFRSSAFRSWRRGL